MTFLGLMILAMAVLIVGLQINTSLKLANLIALARIEFEIRNSNWTKERRDDYEAWFKKTLE